MGYSVLPSQLLQECNLLFVYSEVISKAENMFEKVDNGNK